MRQRRSPRPVREAAVLPWLLVCMGVILSIVAIALDGGRMMQERRRCQDAADAAALVAATDMYLTYSTSGAPGEVHTSSIDAATATAKGFWSQKDQSHVFVDVKRPASGAYAGKANYVEVVVQSNLAGSFGNLLTGQGLVVKARSVAKGKPMAIGLFALSTTASGAISLNNNATVTVKNAGVRVNSSSSTALTTTGNGQASAGFFYVVGSVSSGLSLNRAATTGADPLPDPLASLPVPDQSNMTIQRTSKLTYTAAKVYTLSPGIYRGGIELGGNSQTTLQPGIYVLQGGLSVSGNAVLSGTDVFIYNTYTEQNPIGAFSVTSNGSVNLSAPTSGTYQGISFMQDRAKDVGVSLTGNAAAQVSGVLYAPKATVSVGGGGSTTAGGILANKIAIGGNDNVTIDAKSNLPWIPQINLVE